MDTASRHGAQLLLNAERGNPNFLATVPRNGYFQFGLFAMCEAENSFSYMPEGVGGFPRREGIEARFDIFTNTHKHIPGVRFIKSAVSYVRDHMGIPAGDFIYERSEALLGCMYPTPDRMLKISERIVAEYMRKEMIGAPPFRGSFDLFAVEGGTAAITYLFTALQENHLLKPGDSIALGMPIFTPYIEIPALNDYQLVESILKRIRIKTGSSRKKNWISCWPPLSKPSSWSTPATRRQSRCRTRACGISPWS